MLRRSAPPKSQTHPLAPTREQRALSADGLRPNGLADTTLSNSQASVNPLPIRWQTCQRLAERRIPQGSWAATQKLPCHCEPQAKQSPRSYLGIASAEKRRLAMTKARTSFFTSLGSSFTVCVSSSSTVCTSNRYRMGKGHCVPLLVCLSSLPVVCFSSLYRDSGVAPRRKYPRACLVLFLR